MSTDSVLTRLNEAPVAGVDMSCVTLLRLDAMGGAAPGNKQFKLCANLATARRLGISRLVSFGGPWSNHLHALAALGREQGFATVGIVRGEEETAMLADARRWGMHIVRVSRSEYRRRLEAQYQQELQSCFAPCLVIPEGGANGDGARGCLAIADIIRARAPAFRSIVVAAGTGTTLAGLAAGLGRDREITGIAALRGAADLERRVREQLDALAVTECARWRILHEDHCGGFARVSAGLRDFMLAFECAQRVPLEPVYTGKTLYGTYRRLADGTWDPHTPLLVVHTGGLQGRRGFAWLR